MTRHEPQQSDTVLRTLDWLVEAVPGHAVTQFLCAHDIGPDGLTTTPSPAHHADALPFMYMFKAEPGTFRCTYMGSRVEQFLGMTDALGKTLEEALPPERIPERYQGLMAVHQGRRAFVATNVVMGAHGGKVAVAFVGVPLSVDHSSDVLCFLVPWRADD